MKLTTATYSLTCGHCGASFDGGYKQHYRQTHDKTPCYCSDVCRYAALRSKFSTPVPSRGPCQGCGQEMHSRRETKFCGMKCYTGSKQFTEMLAESRAKANRPESIASRAERAKRGEEHPCLECGTDVYIKKSQKTKKFCSRVCYRSYMAKRFDRYMANPETLSLPQGYDGFLDREELPCLVAGCGWVGRHLSTHANQVHGIKAHELKRAAGFNLSTGLVSRPLAVLLQNRPLRGVAITDQWQSVESRPIEQPDVRNYISLEGREHRAKARALLLKTGGPTRICVGCGTTFEQSTIFGHAKYCSKTCRNKTYARKKVDRDETLRHPRPHPHCRA